MGQIKNIKLHIVTDIKGGRFTYIPRPTAMMDSSEYGYDATFIEEIREEYKCVVCHLVLRNPLQIMSCGHRFCARCFDRIKLHAERNGIQLLCPIDRESVSARDVFPDRGIARTIGNLKVKCGNVEQGCAWVDDLRELADHEERCEFKVIG